MDKLKKTYNTPRPPNQEEIDNLDRWITSIETESVIIKKKQLPTNESPRSKGFTWKFYQTYKEEILWDWHAAGYAKRAAFLPILLKLFYKLE